MKLKLFQKNINNSEGLQKILIYVESYKNKSNKNNKRRIPEN